MKMDYHGWRRISQGLSVALAVLVPLTGLLRIDPRAGALVILDHQVWFSDFFLVAGLWIILLTILVMIYSLAGTVFCGWVCPQNILAEWANHLTQRLLGRRAEVSLEGHKPLVAPHKNNPLNWFLLGFFFLAAAMLFGLIPLLYFYPPATVWSFISFRQDANLAPSLYWIYAFCTLIIFIDIAVIRHFWCRFMCVYRVWQHSFRTRETLHVEYDASRSSQCEKCNYCVTSCFIDLDPRKTDIYDSCINCGECIDACSRLQAKKQQPGLLSFAVGERETRREARIQFRNAGISLGGRSRWMLVILLMGLSMFLWGLWTWEPAHLAVYQAEVQQSSQQVLDYRISVANKSYHPLPAKLAVEGLNSEDYQLEAVQTTIEGAQRWDVILHLSPKRAPGLHPFRVRLEVPGYSSQFPLRHFTQKESAP
jgi:polyferredoxin